MISIFKCARDIREFLEKKNEHEFKIYIRLQMQLDVFIFTERTDEANHYYDEFIGTSESLIKKKDKISFCIVPPEQLDDPYYASVYKGLNSNAVDKIDFGPRYSQNSLLSLPDAREVMDGLPPVVTFYSYKGGMGRTTALVSYAMHLSYNQKKNVVIVDCDLEAPGYLNFFMLDEHEGLKKSQKNGFVEYVCDSRFNDGNVDISDYLVEVDEESESGDGKIWVMPAGNLNESCLDINVLDYWEHNKDYLEGLGKLNSIDSQSLKSTFLGLFKNLKNSVNADVILVDSRTGFNDIFGTLAFNLSTCVVGFFGRSRQTEPGFINLLTTHNTMLKRAEQNEASPFKLQLVYSILPPGQTGGSPEMKDFLSRLYSSNPPRLADIHRYDLLEQIGCGVKEKDKEFCREIRNLSPTSKLNDYYVLFDNINRDVFPTKTVMTPSSSRTQILDYLKTVLAGVSDFAEKSTIDDSSKFFFRSCMKDLFLPEKFIIQGYKGTGKTCLYKALANEKISKDMRKWAQDESPCERIFLQVLPEQDTEYPFKSILPADNSDTENFFRSLWKFVTWNNLLKDDGNEELKVVREIVREESTLKEFVHTISGGKTCDLFEKLLNKDPYLGQIQIDLDRFNKELGARNKSLFVLYDRLDSFVPMLKWSEVVSPLIDFWRCSHSAYENIIPKIFIRTDLFNQTKNVNLVRLEDNIINIEWNIAEVFAYFFKLIFSDARIGELFWGFSRQLGMNSQYIDSIKMNFDKNFNQFKSLKEGEMIPVVQTFFGKEVLCNGKSYGKPWAFFENELANADRNAISLRPFVNLLRECLNSVDLNSSEKECSEILSSEVYALEDVRFKAAQSYFRDIVRDPTAKDLAVFKDVVNAKPDYRYKSLQETLFNQLISEVFDVIVSQGPHVVDSSINLKKLIFANGIMAEKETSRGTFYAFAPIYCSAWKLQDSFIEQEKIDGRGGNASKSAIKDRLVGVLRLNAYQRPYVSVTIGRGNEQREFRYEVREKLSLDCQIGDLVSFKINEIPHKSKPNAVYRVAVGVRRVNQDVLNDEPYATMVVVNEWAVARGMKANDVVNILRKKGVNIQNALDKVDLEDLNAVREELLKPVDRNELKVIEEKLGNGKKSTQKMRAIPNFNDSSNQNAQANSECLIVVNEWAVAHGLKANDVVEELRSNGIDVKNALSKVSLEDLKLVEERLIAKKKATVGLVVVPKLYEASEQDLPENPNGESYEGFWSRLWTAIKKFFTREL